MTTMFKAACVQNCAVPEVDKNLAVTRDLTRAAAAEGAQLICLPEYFSGLETDGEKVHPAAFPEAEHPVIPAFAEDARELNAWIVLGSLGVTTADGRVNNRGYVIDPTGTIRARYNKIHMFDVNLGEGKVYRESATIAPGDQAVVAQTPWGGLGLSVCYDLRFAALYRALAKAGAKMLTVPAAFTKTTGEAHWHVLNRARAIEHGCFVFSPCQYGTLDGGSQCFGHSLIVDPWGRVLADGGDQEGYIVADIDMAEVDKARTRIPALTHDRPFELVEPAIAAE